jgi:glycine cleavage system aminomethyltransferase T
MVPFAGYEMPVQYPGGILAEHRHTRARASLFDVSHMGQARLHGGDAAARSKRSSRSTSRAWRSGASATRSSPTTRAASSTT